MFRRKYVYDYDKPLDTDRMKKAAAYLLGEHDFKAFCGNRHMKKSTVRTIFSIDIEKTGADIVISYTGDGFLQNMIRIIKERYRGGRWKEKSGCCDGNFSFKG